MNKKNKIIWTLETKSIDSLIKNPKNPRFINKKQQKELKTSINKFGLCQPIVIQPSGQIIGGHQRVESAKQLGIDELDVYIPSRELDPKEFEELSIRLNRNLGDWDYDILANEWESDELLTWGFEDKDFEIEVEEIEPTLEPEDEQILDPPKDPTTVLGDLYQLGDHMLLCGDSTNPDDVEKLLNGEEPILMVTDSPYGVNYDAEWRNDIKHAVGICKATGKVKNDDQVNWALAWHLFPGSVAYVWCASLFLDKVAKDLDEVKFERKSLIIWVKQNFALSRGDYHWQHEPCWYAIKKGHKHNWQGSRKESTVWEIANLSCFGKSDEERTNHSTQKPLECMRKPIRNNSAKGEGVYDPFGGSGTTLIACEELGRKCFMMELDPVYCDMIVDRWKRYREKNNLSMEVIKNGKKED
ncbi:MAG: DNA methyltransferase [Psychroflexus sp.]